MANEGEVVVEQPVAPKVGEEVIPKLAEQDDLKKKEEHKANLEKAISEGTEELRLIREAKKRESGTPAEEIPVIDGNNPDVKAWDKRIGDTVAPALNQIEQQKTEVRTFALRKFLADKPALSKSPEKIKELMLNYDKLKTSTEMTNEGIQLDLEKAYGATFHEELTSIARQGRVDQAHMDMISSDIAIDRGASSETTEAPRKKQLSAEEQAIIGQWEQFGAPKL